MHSWHFLRDDMTAGHGNEEPWTEGEERKLPPRIKLVICKVGYHSSPTPFDALFYAPGSVLCLVEIDKPADKQPDKYVSRSRKLIKAINIERLLREFTCDVAERAFNLERLRGNTVDRRSRAAIEVARRYARNEATREELDAARDAATAAVGGAAWYATSAASGNATSAAIRAAICATTKITVRDAHTQRFNTLVMPLFAEVLT